MDIFQNTIAFAGQIAAFIDDHLEERLSIPDIAKKFSVSDFTLKRIFRQVYQLAVHRYILEKRMDKACKLLIGGNLTIKQIATKTGYSRVSSFTYAFRRHFGIPPATFKKRYQKGELTADQLPISIKNLPFSK